MTTANGNVTQQRQPASGFSTGALMGFRLFEAAGWRIAAVALLPLACPAFALGGYILNSVMGAAACIDRHGYTICRSFTDAYVVGLGALLGGVLLLLAAWGLWKRGGAVRDVELLAERVEGSAD